MRRVFVIAAKELRDTIRERSIAMALVTQLFVAMFSAFLTVGLVSLYDPDALQSRPESAIAYVPPPGGAADAGFEAYLRGRANLQVRTLSLESALAAFESGVVDAVAEERYTDPDGTRSVTLLLPDSEFKTTLLVTELKGLLQEYERDLRIEREDRLQGDVVYVDTGARPGVSFGFVFSILLPLLVATPVFLAGAVTGDSFSQELNTKTMALLRSTPVSTTELVLGKVLTPVLLVPAQVALWVLLLAWNGLHVANLGWILLLSAAMGLVLAALSVVIAFAVRKEGMTQSAYAIAVLLLSMGAFLLPQDPLNVVARFAVDVPDGGTYFTLGLYVLIGAVATLGALAVAHRRMARDVA